jgi:hypothetical protein
VPLNLGSARAGVTSSSPFDQPPGAEIKEAVATALETTDPGQARGSSIPDAIQDALDDLNLGNNNFDVPPGGAIRDVVDEALETTDPGQARGSFTHDEVQLILDNLNLGSAGAGVTSSTDFIEPNIGNESALGASVTSFILDEFVPPSPIVPAEPAVPPNPINPVLEPFGQVLSGHILHSDWPLT